MRYIAVILSFIILAFSTTTCTDEPAVHAHESSSAAMADAGTTHHEHLDFCSPLCACGCCAASVVLPVGYFIPVQLAYSTQHYSNIPFGIPAEVSNAVWQPPKA